MKFLVIGGTKFIGKRLVEELLRIGHEVTVFSRGNVEPSFSVPVNHIIGDRHNYAEFEIPGKKYIFMRTRTYCHGRTWFTVPRWCQKRRYWMCSPLPDGISTRRS